MDNTDFDLSWRKQMTRCTSRGRSRNCDNAARLQRNSEFHDGHQPRRADEELPPPPLESAAAPPYNLIAERLFRARTVIISGEITQRVARA